MEENTQSSFNGFALVEIMGHRRAAGQVTTKHIGAAAFLHVLTPAVEPFQKTLERPQRIGYEYLEAGSVVEFSRQVSEIWIGSGSVYAITPFPEEDLLKHAPLEIRIVERAAKPALELTEALASDSSFDADEDSDDEDDDEDEDDGGPF